MKRISFRQLRYYWSVYLFVMPTILLILVFAYFPAWNAIYYSFFQWDGGHVKEFTGFENYLRVFTDANLAYGYQVIAFLVFANLFKMIPSIITAIAIHRLRSARWGYLYRIAFVIPLIIPSMVMILIWKYYFDPSFGVLNAFLEVTHGRDLLNSVDAAFNWGVFTEHSSPAWLARKELIVPSLVLWGFPWVGTIGVLIFLSGLSAISNDIYDSARIDGAGPIKTCLHIELPLIITQIRLNLILMIIGTIQDYGLVLVLLGDSGGAGGAGLLPGLYMFRKAFVDQEVGYACAIGITMFLLILSLTWVNQKFVRIDK